ncbi:hypothetical protein BC833DRAFT_660145, partial [Globomyces pollinis-pini]
MANNERQPVRGPTSALSSFLREKGIRIPTNPYARIQQANAQSSTNNIESQSNQVESVPVNESVNESVNTPTVETVATQSTKFKSTKKSKKKKLDDDDDELLNSMKLGSLKKQKLNQSNLVSDLIQFCQMCHRRFLIESNNNLICQACKVSGKKSNSLVKRSKKKNENMILDLTGEYSSLLSLKNMCIKFLADYIDDVEQLGSVHIDTKIHISRIISKERKLNNTNLMVFLGPYEEELHLFDCTYIDSIGFSRIPMLCPNLKKINLSFCGRMTNEILISIGSGCPNLTSLALSGPYLCSDNSFKTVFSKLPLLQHLKLGFVAKISNGSLQELVQSCPNLETLELFDCPLINDISALMSLTKLSTLKLNSIGTIEQEVLETILQKLGHQLIELSLNNHENLTATLWSTIQQCCTKMEMLSLQNNPGLYEDEKDGIECFTKLKTSLVKLDLSHNHSLTDELMTTVMNIHGPSLTHLNLNSLHHLSATMLMLVAKDCKSLVQVDLSWIRYILYILYHSSLDDPLFLDLMNTATHLEIIKVYGCHQLSPLVLNKPWYNCKSKRILIKGN